MPRLLLIFFALLLVLRGWAGDAMAMPLPAASDGPQTHAVAQGGGAHAAHGDTSGDAADLHGAPHAHTAPQDCGDSSARHSSCGDCQACHTAALPFGSPRLPLATAGQAAPPALPVAYASADAAPGFKPPIFRSRRP